MADRDRIKRQHGGVFPDPPELRPDKDGKIDSGSIASWNSWAKAVTRLLNGGLRLGDDWLNSAYAGNLDGQLVEFNTVGGTTVEVAHGLGRVPLGRQILGQTSFATLKDTNITGWGPKKVYFLADDVCTWKVLLL